MSEIVPFPDLLGNREEEDRRPIRDIWATPSKEWEDHLFYVGSGDGGPIGLVYSGTVESEVALHLMYRVTEVCRDHPAYADPRNRQAVALRARVDAIADLVQEWMKDGFDAEDVAIVLHVFWEDGILSNVEVTR